MLKTIILSDPALKDLLRLPIEHQMAVEQAMENYAIDGRGDMKILSNSPYRRLRVGRYRVIFAEDTITVLAIAIGTRDGQTYRAGKIR